MARPLRLSFENAVYHVMARGNRKGNIYRSVADRRFFLDLMNETFAKYSVICYAFCLMDNHYHLFMKTQLPNLCLAMHYLNSSYANWFKSKNQIVGVVFQGRYKSILVEENRYALSLSAYIHLNPIRAGLVRSLCQYPWSSYLDYIGARKSVIERLDTSLVLALAANHAGLTQCPTKREMSRQLQTASKTYENYLSTHDKMKNPLKEAHKGIVLGSQDFVEKIEKHISFLGVCREIPATKVRPPRSVTPEDLIDAMTGSLGIKKEAIFVQCGGQRRNTYFQLFIYLLKKTTPLSLKEIGAFVGMDYAAVHQVVKRFDLKIGFDSALMAMKNKVEQAAAGRISDRIIEEFQKA